jgi:hypothetical protein
VNIHFDEVLTGQSRKKEKWGSSCPERTVSFHPEASAVLHSGRSAAPFFLPVVYRDSYFDK